MVAHSAHSLVHTYPHMHSWVHYDLKRNIFKLLKFGDFARAYGSMFKLVLLFKQIASQIFPFSWSKFNWIRDCEWKIQVETLDRNPTTARGLAAFCQYQLQHLEKNVSGHSPLLFTVKEDVHSDRSMFRFGRMWSTKALWIQSQKIGISFVPTVEIRGVLRSR